MRKWKEALITECGNSKILCAVIGKIFSYSVGGAWMYR